MTRMFISALIMVVLYSTAPAEENPPSANQAVAGEANETARAREFLELASREAAAYELRLEGADGKLVRHKDPVLRWSNPVLGQIYGGVFLWTSEGRPEAVASIFKWYSPHTHMTHEFQSLSSRNLAATRDGRSVWTTSRPWIDLGPIPSAPVPAESRAGRLRQMRGLARQFSASMDHHKKGKHNLRLLTQPLYRYEDGADEWADGALFAFVLGTDPDAVLMIESRRTDDGTQAWHYALARMNWNSMHVRHNGRKVWDVPRLVPQDMYSGKEPYIKIQFKDTQ
jgi:hypothetical protein